MKRFATKNTMQPIHMNRVIELSAAHWKWVVIKWRARTGFYLHSRTALWIYYLKSSQLSNGNSLLFYFSYLCDYSHFGQHFTILTSYCRNVCSLVAISSPVPFSFFFFFWCITLFVTFCCCMWVYLDLCTYSNDYNISRFEHFDSACFYECLHC